MVFFWNNISHDDNMIVLKEIKTVSLKEINGYIRRVECIEIRIL